MCGRSLETSITMEKITAAPPRLAPTFGVRLGNVALAGVLAFFGVFQMVKVIDALRDRDTVLAVYQTLIGLSTFIMVMLVISRRPPVSRDAGWCLRRHREGQGPPLQHV